MSDDSKFRFLKLTEVMSKTGLSRSGVYKGIKSGVFPRPVKIDGRSVAWLASDVEDWMAYVLLKNGR